MEINSPKIHSEPHIGDRLASESGTFSKYIQENMNKSQISTDNETSYTQTALDGTVTENITITESEDLKLIEYDRIRKTFYIALGSSVIIGLVIFILVIISSAYWQKSDSEGYSFTTYSLHVTFMTLSIPILSSYGILMYRILPETHMWLIKWIHASFFLFVIIFFIFGLLKSFSTLGILFKGDFSTIHSWLGIGIFVLLCLEVGTGVVFLCSDEENHKINSGLKKVHRGGGNFLIVLSSATVITGLDSMKCILNSPTYSTTNTIGAGIFMNALSALMIVFYLVIFLMMFSQRFKRKARPNWTCIYNNPSSTQEISAESSKTVIQKSFIFKNKETT